MAAVDPELPEDAVLGVLAVTAKSRRALRWLVATLAERPGVLVEGPTSTLPVLDRFIRGLVAAGADGVRVVHPPCGQCGRPKQAHARRGRGWVCSACWARTTKLPCAECAGIRRIAVRRPTGGVCAPCLRRQRTEIELDAVTEAIVVALGKVDHGLDRRTVAATVARVAPGLARRRQLAADVGMADINAPERQPVLLSRLVAGLHGQATPALAASSCDDCGRPASKIELVGGSVRSSPCVSRCPDCGRLARQANEAQCRRCRADRHRHRGTCGDCDRGGLLLDEALRCRACRERASRICDRCCGPAPLTRVDDERLCWTCALRLRVDALLSETNEGPTAVLRHALLATANHRTTARWLAREPVTGVLGQVGGAGPAPTHESLDALGPSRSTEHLRDLLVAAGALDGEGRTIARFEARAATSLAGLDAAGRRVVRAWVTWRLLPRLRRLDEAGKDLTNSIGNARASLDEVIRFTGHLRAHGRGLRDCTEADVEEWLIRPGAARCRVIPFLAWAGKKRHLPPMALPRPPGRAAAAFTDPEHRWAIARRLVTDDSIAVADRVAGALVVLYGQPLTRIVGLRLTDVRYEQGRAIVTLAGYDLRLPEPFATLVGDLPVRRRHGVTDQVDTQWLFPGDRAGRHLGSANLANRLRDIDIEPRQMRGAALVQLSMEMLPAVLAEVVGVTPSTAAKWTAASGGSWANYAASR